MYDCNRLSKMDKAGNYHSSTALEVGEMVFAAFFPIVSFGVYSPRKHYLGLSFSCLFYKWHVESFSESRVFS